MIFKAGIVKRRKETVAENLSDAILDAQRLENEVRNRKDQMRDPDGNEIVTSVEVISRNLCPFETYETCSEFYSSKAMSTNCDRKPICTRKNEANFKHWRPNWAFWRGRKRF